MSHLESTQCRTNIAFSIAEPSCACQARFFAWHEACNRPLAPETQEGEFSLYLMANELISSIFRHLKFMSDVTRRGPIVSGAAIFLSFFSSLTLTASPTMSVQPMAITYHSHIPTAELYEIRRRGTTLDDDGRWTFHVGLGMAARWTYFQLNAIYFQNSVNMHSGALMAGPQWSFGKYISLGIEVGPYFRETLPGVKIPFSYQNDVLEIAPMAMATLALAFPIYKKTYFELNVGSNYILNFFSPGIRIEI